MGGGGILKKINMQKNKNNIVSDLKSKGVVEKIEISLISDNPFQPRLSISEDKLKELMLSIEENGLIQPVALARYNSGTNKEELILIAGHRRLEAYRRLGRKTIEANITEEVSKKDLASMAMVENVQRADLHILELAIQYSELIANGIFTSSREIAKAIGKDESTVGKTLKLLKLPQMVIDDIRLNRSTVDLLVLDALRKVEDKDTIESLYSWFVETKATRIQLLNKIKELKCNQPEEAVSEYKIKSNKDSYIITIPKLSEEKMKEIEEFIKKVFLEK